jgi:NAD(P)-dependent dehydrogenase (short-subunit alcohol dehydrogenase family)
MLSGKTLVITGVSSGIGARTAELAIAQGADVVRVHDVAHIARTVRVADAIVRLRT